jgi:glucans biosynthesis protein
MGSLLLGLGSACGTPRAATQAATQSTDVHTQRAAPAFDTPPVAFEGLVARANALAKGQATAPEAPALPQSLLNLDWNAYMQIQFEGAEALWKGDPFSAQFFHLGYLYRTPVHVFGIEGDKTSEVGFDPRFFRYGNVPVPEANQTLGFAGARIHSFLNSPSSYDELMVFQGASYFRPAARGLALGLSGRGLAIDTGLAKPEEFPRFSELYLLRTAAGDTRMWVLALLESPRATGAYAFCIAPGDTTYVDVTAHVFLRDKVDVLGLSPLTSMFLFGEDEPARFGDSRPEVHDSDALVMLAQNGERLLRPLTNPPRTKVSTFRLDSPKGFGLVQRDRKFDHYQDLLERYEDRPTAYIEPQGDWGPGAIRMQEMATPLETDDNIAMMWVPDTLPGEAGLRYAYRMHVGRDVPGVERYGHVTSTRVTRTSPEKAKFTIEFALPSEPASAPVVEATATPGKVSATRVVHNPHTGGVRAEIDVERASAAEDVELRAYLRAGNDALSETWMIRWPAKN